MFRDRVDAGRKLAAALVHLAGDACVVIGLPRGGVVVASEVARALQAPLDVFVVRKLGAPHQPELALGAITNGDHLHTTLNQDLIDSLHIDDAYLQNEIECKLLEVRRRTRRYRAGRAAVELTGRTVIVVDDGIATGATVHAGLLEVREHHPRRIVLATPVAAPDSLVSLRPLVDDVVCLHAPPDFRAVGMFYRDFDQTTDEQVIALLDRFQTAERS